MVREQTTETSKGSETMTTEEKAYTTGARDKADGYFAAIKICKERASKGDANCAAYVRGFSNAGIGE